MLKEIMKKYISNLLHYILVYIKECLVKTGNKIDIIGYDRKV